MRELMFKGFPFFCSGLLVISLFSFSLYGQDRCATMDALTQKFTKESGLRERWSEREKQFKKEVDERIRSGKVMRAGELANIPVVFHVVLSNQSLVSDRQILAQLDTINKDFSGTNAGSVNIPAHFKSLMGKSGIQFCLAQRTPDNKPTTGIVRYSTTKTSFDWRLDDVKSIGMGGANSWNSNGYLNIWICELTEDILGYASFPGVGPAYEQGIVLHHGSLPGGASRRFNEGKTLTHEMGHFFNLYHIWGDDEGGCSGTDFVDDTPNQANRSTQCATGIVTDACTRTGPGIMYQNFMDYTPDACLMMFTTQQVTRIEAAYQSFWRRLGNSQGCMPIALRNRDASLKAVIQPEQRLCSGNVSPVVIIRNMGNEPLTSLKIQTNVDNGTVVSYDWKGNLGSFEEQRVTLPTFSVSEGDHVLTASTSLPNGVSDEDLSNDTFRFSFSYYEPIPGPVREGFEGGFLSVRWDVVNPDGGNTWEQTTLTSYAGSGAVRIKNFNNALAVAQKDYLRAPTLSIAGTDSVFVSFRVAAATFSPTSSASTAWDTLQVMVSTDCGLTYTSVYKKWGASLKTRETAVQSEFVPAASDWRLEVINISEFIPKGNVVIAFVNTNGNQNTLYLDDINIRTVTVNPNVKLTGFLVSPNPTSDVVSLQFYPRPTGLRAIQLFSALGQKILETKVPAGGELADYSYSLKHLSSGIYLFKAIFDDRVLVGKVVKVN